MEIHLDKSAKSRADAIISKLVIHDDKGKTLFSLEYSPTTEEIEFHDIDQDEITDLLVKSKAEMTTEKGVEAFGSFISGATNEIPVYRHLLSIYLPEKGTKFTKYHITLESTLEQFDFKHSLIYSAEFYLVFYDALQDYLDHGSINPKKYPLIRSFFHRSYHAENYQRLMNNTSLDGEQMKDEKIIKKQKIVEKIVEKNLDKIIGLDLFITTLNGAIMAKKQFLDHATDRAVVQHLTYNSIFSPGFYSEYGQTTLWFPFMQSNVGKIDRSISTVLNTLNYARDSDEMREQVQTNIAFKFQEIVDIMGNEIKEKQQTYGIQTNIGHLVCAIKFHKKIENDLGEMLSISHKVADRVKDYGQAILATVANSSGFEPIIE